MFNLIKTWFKRPVIINFDVETIPDDAKVCVLTTDHILTPELCEHLRKRLSDWHRDVKFIVVGMAKPLQTLNDEDLKAIGLVRISKIVIEYPGVSELDLSNTYPLPKGERIVGRPFL